MKTQQFRGKSRAEADAKADAWLQTNPQVKNPKRSIMNVRSGTVRFSPKHESGRWNVEISYEE
jgi:hypothetical protein